MLYLLRHGETEWSRAGRKQGRGDSPLTPLGVRQVEACARSLAEQTAADPSVHLVTSPLGRAMASAEIIRAHLGLSRASLSIHESLAEHDYGAWEGLTSSEIEDRFPGQLGLRHESHWSFVIPDGESYEQVAGRVGRWLASRDSSQTLVAVAHDMVSRVLRGLYLGLRPSAILSLDHTHTRIYVLARGQVQTLEAGPVAAPQGAAAHAPQRAPVVSGSLRGVALGHGHATGKQARD